MLSFKTLQVIFFNIQENKTFVKKDENKGRVKCRENSMRYKKRKLLKIGCQNKKVIIMEECKMENCKRMNKILYSTFSLRWHLINKMYFTK